MIAMIDHNYVEKFSFENIIYMMVGAATLMGPWMLVRSFWNLVESLSTYQMVSYNLFIFVGTYLYFMDVLLRHTKHPLKWAAAKAFRRTVFVYVTTFVVTIIILLLYNQVSLEDPASLFSRKVFSGLVACLLGGMFFDLLMNK
ncbi:hypothetical protein D6764_04435 [Candidatus Woesearchaeota archaeon]|nr:MAG: hypothetical protein D6764_04435 [Candidatus Woesearchaeota archaeon]